MSRLFQYPTAMLTVRTVFCGLWFLTVPMLAVASQGSYDSRHQFSLRGGVSDDMRLGQAELAYHHRLPWGVSLSRDWSLRAELQAALGWIGNDQDQAPIGSLGPAVRFHSEVLPVSIVAGSAPTLLGRNRLDGHNFGSAIQFTSHVGVDWRISRRIRAGYRVHHMSNAGLGSDNPGVNIHMASISWHF